MIRSAEQPPTVEQFAAMTPEALREWLSTTSNFLASKANEVDRGDPYLELARDLRQEARAIANLAQALDRWDDDGRWECVHAPVRTNGHVMSGWQCTCGDPACHAYALDTETLARLNSKEGGDE